MSNRSQSSEHELVQCYDVESAFEVHANYEHGSRYLEYEAGFNKIIKPRCEPECPCSKLACKWRSLRAHARMSLMRMSLA